MDVLAQILSVAGAFAIFDSFLPQKQKDIVSEYIFGFRHVPINKYEWALVDVFIGAFVKYNRVSFLRIFMVSLIVSPMIVLCVFPEQFEKASHGIERLLYKITGARIDSNDSTFFVLSLTVIIFGVVSAPFDYINVKIGKFIYYRKPCVPRAFRLFFMDFALSILMLILAVMCIDFFKTLGLKLYFPDYRQSQDWTLYWWDTIPYYIDSSIIGVGVSILASSLFYYFLRVTAVILGITLRVIFVTTNLNSNTIAWTDAHNVPFTFLSLIFMSGYYFVTYLLKLHA